MTRLTLRHLALASFASLFALPALARPVRTLTADGAVRLALERNPELASLGAEVKAGQARLRGASLLLQTNPEVGIALGPRQSERGRELDVDAELSQRLEIFGQRSARIGVARADIDVSKARLAARRNELAAEVRVAFARALSAVELLGVARQAVDLARQTLKAAEKRLEVGDGSKIEVNTARIEVGRASRELRLGTQRLAAGHKELRLLLALESTDELRLQGDLKTGLLPTEDAEMLVRRAQRARADLIAAHRGVEVATAEGQLARKEWLPRPRLGARYQREEGADAILGTLSLDLPVFNRNQAGQGVAAARLIQARRALEATLRRVRQEVLLAHSRLITAREAARAYEGEVVQAAQENLALLATAYRAGKIGLFELILIRRDALEARRGHIESVEDVRVAEAELRRAVGAEGGSP